MKKNFEQPKLMVVRFDKDICTDIIAVSTAEYGGKVYGADRFRDWEDEN